MKALAFLFLTLFLYPGDSVFSEEQDACDSYFTKEQCRTEGKEKGCIWLASRDLCMSKTALREEKKRNKEKNLDKIKKQKQK